MDAKQCSVCHQWKAPNRFHRQAECKDGLKPACKDCSAQKDKAYREANRERISRVKRAWNVRNQARRRLVHKRWREQNRARVREVSHAWWLRNKDRANATKRRYRKKFPEKVAAWANSTNLRCVKGKDVHHWSYKRQHWKDVFFLTPRQHVAIHDAMNYDQTTMLYRTMEGILIESRTAAAKYYAVVLGVACVV